MKAINIVWLKRDLRTQDHAPFNAAEKEGLRTIQFTSSNHLCWRTLTHHCGTSSLFIIRHSC